MILEALDNDAVTSISPLGLLSNEILIQHFPPKMLNMLLQFSNTDSKREQLTAANTYRKTTKTRVLCRTCFMIVFHFHSQDPQQAGRFLCCYSERPWPEKQQKSEILCRSLTIFSMMSSPSEDLNRFKLGKNTSILYPTVFRFPSKKVFLP